MRKKQISGIMKNEKAIKRILEIKATQWKWINGKLVHIQLSIKDQNEIAALEKLLSNPFSKKEFALYSKIITEAGGTVMKETLQNAKSEKNFFAERISKTHGKHNLPNELWERLCKIRNSPIELTENLIVGDIRTAHTVIPSGAKGYIIVHPEAFVLTDQEISMMHMAPKQLFPASLMHYPEIVFLKQGDFKAASPFFDFSLASFAAAEVEYGSSQRT